MIFNHKTIDETSKKVLKDDLFILGKIEPESNGLLSLEDWDRIYRIVNKQVALREILSGMETQGLKLLRKLYSS